MIKILVRLDFFYDGEDTIDQFILMVKSGTSFDDVEEELLKAHKYLCEEDETDLYTINVTDKQFNDLENCLSGNPEFLLFSTNLSDITLKVDLKQEKEKKDSAENIVVRWMNDIRKKTISFTDYSSATKMLGEIKSYCEAVIVAVTSK